MTKIEGAQGNVAVKDMDERIHHITVYVTLVYTLESHQLHGIGQEHVECADGP